ncbi:hypothetical protein TI39_contig4153g00001 [Zymoseptoria brevis]|uniref:Major facilitator superfamily (MFS) profile domain-containing protein n=1 Tax=Zymoseptoria brevis TaxID=1047168 RepID=A0A0F4GCZ4_9PEZI|nr:hypothetical protein TI39_contig4153g00001 [Zymoseptoria brevis]
MAATILDVSMRFATDSFEAPARTSVLAAPIFLLGQALGPLFWNWPMRRLGQKACLTFGFTAFVGFQLPIIAARGVATVLMLRFFAGLMGCAPLLGIITLLVDLWLPEDCAITSSILSSFLIMGPLAGRMIGAFVTESTSLGWRWPSLIISGVSIFVGIVCWLVWSRPADWLRCIKRSVRAPQKICARNKGPDEDAVHHSERLPGYTWTSIRRLILDPSALLVSVHTSYVYSLLFFVTETYPLSFEDNRHWSTGQGVVPLVSVMVGVMFGWTLNFISSYERLMKPLTSKVYTRPETHLQVMAVGAILTPIGLLVAAWTSFPNLSPVAQVMAGTPVGMGIILVFLKGNDFLLEIHDRPDSFTAVNIVLRSALAAMFAGVSRHFYEDLGPQKTGTVMGLVSLVFVAIPILLMNARFKIRKSSYLPTHRTARIRDTGE